MLNDVCNEKIHKKFMNFKEEELWLQRQLEDGWVLERYSNEFEEGTYYTFKKTTEYARKHWIFKVDFREFDEQEDYFDYVSVFKESGWSTLSQPGYSKHIFFTNTINKNLDIFSDVDSFTEREKRVMQASIKNCMIYLSFLIASLILYSINKNVFFIGSALFSSIASIRYSIRYLKNQKTLKSIHQ